MRKMRFLAGLAVAAIFTLASGIAQAGYVYSFSFDDLYVADLKRNLAASQIDFRSPALIAFGGFADRTGGSINGYTPAKMHYNASGPGYAGFDGDLDFGVPLGDIGGFSFTIGLGATPFDIGVYHTNHAGRAVRTSSFALSYYYGSGTLTVSSDNQIPEPATMGLLGAALLAGALGRRRCQPGT